MINILYVSINIMYQDINYPKLLANDNITVSSMTGLPLHGPLSTWDKPEPLLLFLHKRIKKEIRNSFSSNIFDSQPLLFLSLSQT